MSLRGLKIYTVHLQPDVLPGQQRPVFVREGFNIFAFLFTGLWTLYQRLWLKTLFLVAFNVAVVWLDQQHLISSTGIGIVQFGVQILVGFQGQDWVRARLDRQGYVMADVAAADSMLRAEQRYFERVVAA